MNNYDVVPEMISDKDLKYLEDVFNWNYIGYKLCFNALDYISSEDIKELDERVVTMFFTNMKLVMNRLGGHDE